MKPELGQELFSLNIGNTSKRRKQLLTPCVVTKVGRKYFTVKAADDNIGWSASQYHIDGWNEKTDYSPNSRLYPSEQAWKDEKEESQLARKIYDAFEYGRNKGGLPLESLRAIDAIISC